MILDEYVEFADAASVAAAAGTAVIGDVVDLGIASPDLSFADHAWFVIQCTTAIITGGTAGTIAFQLVSASDDALTTDVVIHVATAAFVTDDAALNDLNIGDVVLATKFPSGDYGRYLGVRAVIATTTVTAGAVNAFVTSDFSRIKHFPEGDN